MKACASSQVPDHPGEKRYLAPSSTREIFMRLLIADDHDLVRDTLAAFLDRENDIETVVVGDLDGALAEISGQPAFDLILLDYGMPGMNGLDGFERARAAAEQTPVVLISGMAQRDVAEAALARGAAPRSVQGRVA